MSDNNLPRGARRPLPSRRRSWTQKIRINNQVVHVGFGEYEDGTLGEVWIDMHKCGSSVRGFVGALARMVSVALQYGTPPAAVVSALKGIRFDPEGSVVGSPEVVEASSVADYVARQVEATFLGGAVPPCPDLDSHY